jgi:two-component system response regulator YesN
MKLHKKIDNREIFYQYLLTYFVVLFIPLFICCIYYIRMISVINADDIKARQTELEHAAVLVDTTIDELSSLSDSLASNVSVNSFKRVSKAFGVPNSYKVYELQKNLPDLHQINQSIFDYYIFFDKSEIIVNRNMAYTYKDFYNLYLHEENFKDYDDWYQYIKNDHVVYGLSPMKSYQYKKETLLNMISYSRPLMYGDNSKIQILLEDTVLKTLMPALTEHSIQYIEDFQDRILYYSTQDEHVSLAPEELSGKVKAVLRKGVNPEKQAIYLNDEKYLIIKHVSEQSGLSYVMLQPEVVVNSRSMYSTIVLLIFIFFALAVGIALSFHMSLKSATPINDILRAISHTVEQGKGQKEVFSTLKTTFVNLVNKNSDLAKVIEEQKPFLRNSFFNRLLYGGFTTEEEITRIADYISLPCKNRVFWIVIFRFYSDVDKVLEDDLKLMNSCLVSLMEVIKNIMPDSLYTSLDDQIVLLMNTEVSSQDDYKKETEQWIQAIKEAMPSDVIENFFVYGGNEVNNLSDIKESYNNAVSMFQCESGKATKGIIWYMEDTLNIPPYPPQDFSVRLIHYVMSGDKEGLHDALEEIIKTYFFENTLPSYLQHMLLNELQTVLFRSIARMGMNEEEYKSYYSKLEENHNSTLINQISTTFNLYRSVCSYMNDKKELQNSAAITTAIASYIDINYGDSNLSLTTLADMFHISEPYLSYIFKQSLGTNFSTYMEGIRIDKAKELLKETSLSVSEIAEHVGYSSANSFCRAFKRVTGSSASEYRKR